MTRSKKNKGKGPRPPTPPRNPAHPVTVERRLQNVTEAFESVRHALEDFNAATSLSRQKTAVRNLVEQARSVTWTAEQLKPELGDEWDRWWDEATAELRRDAVAQFFYRLRNPIIKEGTLDFAAHAELDTFSTSSSDFPPGVTGIAFGTLGLVWVTEDGDEIPVDTPLGTQRRWTSIVGIPDEFENDPLPLLMQRYVEVLGRVVIATHAQFRASG